MESFTVDFRVGGVERGSFRFRGGPEVRNETARVTWPSRKEVYATTIVVILTSIFFGVYLWGVDLVLSAMIGWVFRTFGVA